MSFTVTLTPGKVFTRNEEIDNDKLNQLGNPSATITGGGSTADLSDGAVIASKTTAGNFFYADGATTNAASGIGANIKYTLAWTNNIKPTALNDGVVVAWTPNTDATGSVSIDIGIGGEKLVKKLRAESIINGDLVANQMVEMRYSAAAGYWQLMVPTCVQTTYWGGVATFVGSTYSISITPPASHTFTATDILGKLIGFKANNACGVGANLTVNWAGSAITAEIRKNYSGVLAANDIVVGQVVYVVHDGTYWNMQVPVGTPILRYTSAATALPVAGTPVNFAHGLGSTPTRVSVRIINVTAEGGYVTNDVAYLVDSGQSGSYWQGVSADATNVTFVYTVGISITNRATGTQHSVDSTKWKILVDAWKE